MAPFDLFVAQHTSDSTEARVDAMKKLALVGEAIGTEATLGRLVPHLTTSVAVAEREEDDDDEILLILAGQLALMVPGLVPGHRALPLLPILERLCSVEETVVRDKAVETVNHIVPLLLPRPDDDKRGNHEDLKTSANSPFGLLLATSKRLAGADWFTAKVSAAGVLPAVYAFWNVHADSANANVEGGAASNEESRRELRLLFKDLSEDDTPMVRRSAAKHLGRFVEAVAGLTETADVIARTRGNLISTTNAITAANKTLVQNEMVPIFQALSIDEQDSVRLLAVSCAGSVGCGLARDANDTAQVVLPVVRGGCADLSWRVRHNLAKQFSTVTASFGFVGPKHLNKQIEVFQCFAGLLQDNEAEVRAAAVENIARMAHLGGQDLFKDHIAPLLPNLADDLVMEVRSKLAQTLMDCVDPNICNTLDDAIVLEEFKPLLESFLNDEFAEVQLHILTKLSRVAHLLGKMDVVVSSILQMAKAQNWRVREAVGRLLPHLAEARGVQFFEDHLLDAWLKILADQVADVRSACIAGMSQLLDVTGTPWLQTHISPHYQTIYENSRSYLSRITVLRSYAALSGATKPIGRPLLEEMVAIMLKGLGDNVANVRMIAAMGLGALLGSGHCDEAMAEAKVRPALEERVNVDEDDDCKYECQCALEAKS